MSDSGFGILSSGSYVPRGRLTGKLIAETHGWFEPTLKSGVGVGRSFAGWDEDALTMAVEAVRDCMNDADTCAEIDLAQVELASTSLPYADRSNVGILREALGLSETARLVDSGGSLRAASSALLRALEAGRSRLLVASDCVDSKPASPGEATLGHAAAAMLVGTGSPMAILRGSASRHQDFVDHYRAAGERFSYTLEARWTRDAGYRQQTAETHAAAMEQAGIAERTDRLIVSAPPALAKAIAKSLRQDDLGATLSARIGYCAAAQPLLLLRHAFEQAQAGETIALVSIGQGIDVIVFELTARAEQTSLSARAAAGVEETNYTRYLSLRRLLELEEGIRAERDNRTAQAAFWRKHEAITGFIGGQCRNCGTLQFPPSRVCVECGAEDSQSPRRMSELRGTVRSFTEDWLAFTPNPPLIFGNVGFGDGANVMMEFTDVSPGELKVGIPVELRFRIKDFDHRRGFRRYFWKPTPVAGGADG